MLEGSRISLRAPTDADQQLLLSLRNDFELQQQLMAVPRPNTAERVTDWIRRKLNDDQGVLFVIVERVSRRGCGFLQVQRIDTLHGTGELGIALAPTARGQGFAQEAILLTQRYLRDAFRLRKLTLQVLAGNESAIRLYTRLKFRTAGQLQRHFYCRGEYHDVLIMEAFLDERQNS